jgi:hypothetical protein
MDGFINELEKLNKNHTIPLVSTVTLFSFF